MFQRSAGRHVRVIKGDNGGKETLLPYGGAFPSPFSHFSRLVGVGEKPPLRVLNANMMAARVVVQGGISEDPCK